MAYYLIGAGGTGAKCINAFVHLCAAGLMPDSDPVQVYFVDADTTNGNRSNTLHVIDVYQKAHRALFDQNANLGPDCPILKTDIKYEYGNDFYNWNPLANNNYTLDKILQIGTLPQEYRNLYQILYPSEKREATFQNGFLGWPSVGSAIVSSAFEQLSNLTNLIANDANAKVLLVGSIFGGTGAASIPTLAKLIHQSFSARGQQSGGMQNRSLGMVMMLPYFMFDNSKGGTGNLDDNPNIEPLNFALKTKIALQYYYSHGLHQLCSRIYLLGDSFNNKVASEKQIGGQKQNNKAHYMELYAGLASLDFFSYNPPPPNSPPVHVYQETCRQEKKVVSWTDLPYYAGKDVLFEKLSKMISMAYAYNASFAPILKSLTKPQGKSVNQFPWYINLIQGKADLAHPQTFEAVGNLYLYNRQFLDWLREIHLQLENDPESVNVTLVNPVSLSRYFSLEEPGIGHPSLEVLSNPDYVNLLQRLPGVSPPPKGGLFQATGFDLVRKNMAKHKPPNECTHLGGFLNALYHCTL